MTDLPTRPVRLRRSGAEFPAGLITASMVLVVALLLGVAFTVSELTGRFSEAQAQLTRMAELRGLIDQYDEVLTMSTRMAAATGDPRWEARYRRIEPLLGDTLDEALRIEAAEGSTVFAGGVAATDAANDRLVSAELAAFAHVREGRLLSAQRLLDAPSYQEDKRAYSSGIATSIDAFQSTLSARTSRLRRVVSFAQGSVFLVGLAMLGIWLLLVRALLQWRERVEDAEQTTRDALGRVSEAAHRLESANATLEHRVDARTAEITRQRDELRRLTENLLTAEEQERQRLSAVLHDQLQQLLVTAQFQLGAMATRVEDPVAARLRDTASILRSAVQESRTLATELNPPLLLQGDLRRAFAGLASTLSKTTGLQVEVDVALEDRLTDQLQHFLFRTARELLLNVGKHADTNQAWLSLTQQPEGRLILTVEDRGNGFVWNDADGAVTGTGLGLAVIRQRTQWLGGQLDIQSAVGTGTAVRLVVPIPAQDDPPDTGATS